MGLKPGRVDDFTNSMAAAMEDAFQSEWLDVKGTALPGKGEEDRKILFSAVARGVVKHLQENAATAFQIAVTTKQTSAVLMESENPSVINVSGGGAISSGAADVRQKNSAANMVESVGAATITAIVIDE